MSKDITKIVRQTLGIESAPVALSEALVTDPKPFNLSTEFQSASAKRSHFELYENYIKAFNRVSAELDGVDRSDVNSNNSVYRSLKIDETYNMNAIFLHELYFANISDMQSKITMDSLSYMRLQRDFGSFDKWQEDFLACCQASRCGWAVTYYNLYTQTYMNAVVDLHSIQIPVGCFPVIVMDVWQHAYYKDYLRDVKTYSIAMMKELNWTVIEGRFKQSERLAQALRAS
jgi:Fe-Mn family superoxide dismutase